jgi:methylmalonyl-CoA/ethylmalonyl-CoA epimerase
MAALAVRSTSFFLFLNRNLMRPGTPKGARIAHVGIAVRTLEDLAPFCREVLQLETVELADMDGAHIVGFGAEGPLVELLEAVDENSPIGRFVARRGPAIHHICFAVDDLDATLSKCRAAGFRLIDETPRLGAEGKRIAFLHPSSTGGVLVELTESG